MPRVLAKRLPSCVRPARKYKCLRGCGARVTPDTLVCPWCLFADAKRADQAGRLLMPSDDQKGTAGADFARQRAKTKLKERDEILCRLMKTTDAETLSGLRRSGLSALLERASIGCPKLAKLAGGGRTAPSTAGASG